MHKLNIKGFKCFIDDSFDIDDITLLTGNNSSGKSSVIQAILLYRIAIEKMYDIPNDLSYSSILHPNTAIPLNGEYELNLGTVNDIYNQTKDANNSIIQIGLDRDVIELSLPAENEEILSVNAKFQQLFNIGQISQFWRKKEFYYLNTERLGPRLGLDSEFMSFIHCGFKGEFTAQVLNTFGFEKINANRLFRNSKSEFLSNQVDYWLDYICPGTTFKVESLGPMRYQIKLRNNSVNSHVLPTNIGFGISYVLPIIVNGLIAENGSAFIIENPEAHLHPKGQSNIGYFLGIIAASGVKVIVETHSEHVINGFRRAVLTSEIEHAISPKLNIYFFNDLLTESKRITQIKMSNNGDLSDFPADFFDQVQQDLIEIRNLGLR